MKTKQTVMLEADLVRQIQNQAMARNESVLGSVQRTLARGAELALAELRGNEPYKDKKSNGTSQSNIGNTTIDGYNSLRVVEAAKKAVQSLAEIKADLESAMEEDVTATTTERDSLDEALSDAEAQSEKFLAEAIELKEEFDQHDENSRRIKQQGNRKAPRRRA